MPPLPKLFEPLLCLVMVLAGLFAVLLPQSRGAERISFSISDSEPQTVQSRGDGAVKFSIHDRTPTVTKSATPTISFSVHDAQELKPECSPARTLNRVLVLHATKTVTLVKVCDANGCRFVEQVSPQTPPASAKLLAEVAKLTEKKSWKAGATECDHFWLVDIDEPKNAALIKDLGVKRDELPLLVKESDANSRKKAAGMKAHDLAQHWNNWFREPQAEAQPDNQQCLPTVGGFASGPRWDYTGNGTLRQHLTDPRGAHHLPAAVVNEWTDSQVQTWHNWHHEVMAGRRAVQTPVNQSTERQGASRRSNSPGASARPLTDRITAIARATIRSPPAQMVADASGHSDKSAKKKPSVISSTGSRTSVSA